MLSINISIYLNKLKNLKDYSFFEIIKKIFNRCIFSYEKMERYGVIAGECIAPKGHCPYNIEVLKPDEYSSVLNSNPHLTQEDVDLLKKCKSFCIVVKHQEKIIASTWMIRGKFKLRELGHTIITQQNEYFSTRSHVNPEFRGKRLLGFMKYYFAKNYAMPNDKLWSLIYKWNERSKKANQHIGWKYQQDVKFIMICGRQMNLRFKIYDLRLMSNRKSEIINRKSEIINRKSKIVNRKSLILGLGLNGLSVARTLAKKGVLCYGIYSHEREAGNVSHYCKPVFIPDIKIDRQKYIEQLKALLSRMEEPPVVFATDDLTLECLADQVLPNALYTFGNAQAVKRLLNKWELYQACQEAGIETPETMLLTRNVKLSKNWFPCILKPVMSYLDTAVCIDKVRVLHNQTELEQYLDLALSYPAFKYHNVIVQKVVPGPDTNVVFCALHMNRNLMPDALLTARKLHQYPPGFGVASACRIESIPEIMGPTIQLLRYSGYSGIAEAEYKWDNNLKKYVFIEVNPRAWTNNKIADSSGVPIIWNAYLSAACCPASSSKNTGRRVIWIDEINYIGSLKRKYAVRNSPSNSTPNPPPLPPKGGMRGVEMGARGVRFGYADIHDPMPFLKAIFYFVKGKISR